MWAIISNVHLIMALAEIWLIMGNRYPVWTLIMGNGKPVWIFIKGNRYLFMKASINCHNSQQMALYKIVTKSK